MTANHLGRLWTSFSSGAGTASFVSATNSYQLSAPANVRTIARTRQSHPYFSGKAQQIEFTCYNLTTVANETKRIGYFSGGLLAPPDISDLDGIYLESSSGVVSLCVTRTGTAVLNLPQSSWNGDKLDGTGPSGVTINWNNFNVFLFDFLYLGGAVLNFYAFANGRKTLLNSQGFTNSSANTFVKSPNQPFSFATYSSPSGVSTLDLVCCQVSTMGPPSLRAGITLPLYLTGSGNVSTARGIFGFRLSTTATVSERLAMCAFINSIKVAANGGTDVYSVWLVANPTLAGAAQTWTNLTASTATSSYTVEYTSTVANNKNWTLGSGEILWVSGGVTDSTSADLQQNYYTSLKTSFGANAAVPDEVWVVGYAAANAPMNVSIILQFIN